jgi:ribonuclease E
MPKLMLIDAAHAEETRVVICDGTRIEELDFESAAKRQLRGNIYLAKVTRVEPSLQAAFIEYGGNRHGFLAFNEIHPDYYQLPLADREALLRDLADDSDRHHDVEPKGRKSSSREEGGEEGEDEHEAEDGAEAESSNSDDDDDDAMEQEVERRRRKLLRKYKIQEVIKRRQIMLVQVVKEERGNKGAALTTYLSLAGRYGVLMPNTARGGGISRKIVATADRRKLKTIVQGLDVPHGMGLIIRTAGAKRTKSEIQRDYDYLMRSWEGIREKTMNSIAPAQIYAEEDLVKRAVRDMYDKDIEAVIVEGDAAFKDARDIMRMLMPAQAKKVQHHRDATPLLVKYRVEDQLSQIYSPVVPLRSGGYLVINQTEALVAIDVNSGRATKERNIEATALKTNMEAAEEACRQLRLRDLAGLIVIDFIDMDEGKNNRAVEKKLKDGLAEDRARVQMGKISMFGLMEISRQRRRTGVLEGTTHVCEHCGGSGRVRTVESAALSALRAVEVEATRGAGSVTLRVPRSVGLYILNEKRGWLEHLNQTTGLFVTVLIDDAVKEAEHAIDRTGHTEGFVRPVHESSVVLDDDGYVDEELDEEEEEAEENEGGRYHEDEDGEEGGDTESREARQDNDGDARRGRGRRRRRGGRGAEREDREATPEAAGQPTPHAPSQDDSDDADGRGRRRRRGRRGGRRTREEGQSEGPYHWARMRAPDGDPYVWLDPAEVLGDVDAPPPAPDHASSSASAADDAPETFEVLKQDGEQDIWVELPAEDDTPRSGRNRRSRGGRGRGRDRDEARAESAAPESASPAPQIAAEPAPEPEVEAQPEPVAAEEAPAKPKRASRAKAKPAAEAAPAVEASVAEAPVAAAPVVEAVAPAPKPKKAAKPKVEAPAEPDPAEIAGPPPEAKRGWWRR